MRAGRTKICPTCGRELDERPWTVCPFCKEPLDGSLPSGMMTDFGVGFSAALATVWLSALLLHTAPIALPPEARLFLIPIASGAVAFAVCMRLAEHLTKPMRRSFERIIIAALMAIFPAGLVAVFSLSVWATAATAALAWAAVYSYLRRLPPEWGTRPPE